MNVHKLLISTASSLALLITASFPCLAKASESWQISQVSEIIGTHTVQFNADGFRINNAASGLVITFDKPSAKLYCMDEKVHAYCELPQNPFPGIAAYHLCNLSWGTFHDYKIAKMGSEPVGQFQTAKYLGDENGIQYIKQRKKPRLKVLMLQPEAYPKQLSMVMCYMYALPLLPGVPVKIVYDAQHTSDGRLTSKSLQQVPGLHFETAPPVGWKKVKSQNELTVQGANIDYRDLLDQGQK